MSIVIQSSGKDEVVLDNASFMEITDDGIMVNALFEPPKLIPGTILKRIDFLSGKVVLTKKKEQQA